VNATGHLVDVHVHFLHAGAGRADWEAANRRRLEVGARVVVEPVGGSVGWRCRF